MRRSTRVTRPVERLDPQMKGQAYVQLETAHNLFTQGQIDPEKDIEYSDDHAILIARTMVEICNKVTLGMNFTQQYNLREGLK